VEGKMKRKDKTKDLGEWEKEIVSWLRRKRPMIYTVLRHVSSSGMFRRIDVYAIRDNKPLYLSGLVEELCHYKRDKHREGLKVSGCGMDMGFAIVYDFSSQVFPNGFRYRKGESHRNGDPALRDRDGGYALRHEWL